MYLPVQEMQKETPSYEALLQGLVNLGLCLYPTAPKACVQELSDDLTQLQERCTSLNNSISHRQYSWFTFHIDYLNCIVSPYVHKPVKIVITVLFLIQTAFHLSFRLELLQSQLSQLELFDQALLTLTQRSESFLSGLRSTSQVDVADLEVAITKLKVRSQ